MPGSKIEKKLLHYVGKAIADFNLIQTGDRVLVCLSGGKDSFTLVKLLRILEERTNGKFTMFVFTLNQGQPGWIDSGLKFWLENNRIPFTVLNRDTFSVVREKISPEKTYCSFCSRLRRGIIYRYAREQGFKKIALGHHRDDLIESLLMSILYSGEIRSQPPKLLTDDKKHIVIRPLIYCQEEDIIKYAAEQNFPIIPCGLCANQKNSTRAKVKLLIKQLAAQNPKVPSNILHALQGVRISQLMDQKIWDYKNLEDDLNLDE
ncbi:MAG: tRNA 2-thiocytidine(32) synthetase TtcA [Gammaproteobacteria bacterium]|nr:tRNA 2-thiocytidine(32) synthetase TtcA [Gammaproteobacteria bacterium]